jgi:hypothetical protein
VGRQLFDVDVDYLSGECEMQIWEIRTIRVGKITAIQRNEWTWVKLSSKNGDWGWARSIDSFWRKTWPQNAEIPSSLSTTRAGAWRRVLKAAKAGKLYIDDPVVTEKVIRTAAGQISRRRVRALQKGAVS